MRVKSFDLNILWRLVLLALLVACSSPSEDAVQRVDTLNHEAYTWRYRDIDSLLVYANEARAIAHSEGYTTGEAEALSNIMAARFHAMDFDGALMLADSIERLAPDDVELLVADVMRMKIAQRTANDREFFTRRTRALKTIERLEEERRDMSDHTVTRLDFACSELHIVSATYFYYVDQLARARDEIHMAEPYCQLTKDSAQWLYHAYMLGSGGLIDAPNAVDVACSEFEYLFKCYTFAKRHGYKYFEANSLQSLAMLFADSTRLAAVEECRQDALGYLRPLFPDNPSDEMAHRAYELFCDASDPFQTACALRTLGTLATQKGDYELALIYFKHALEIVDGKHVSEWEAGIREQMSLAYSGLGDRAASDECRNIFLDLRDATRQDAEASSRLADLQAESKRLNLWGASVVCLAVLLAIIIIVLRIVWTRREKKRMKQLSDTYEQRIQQAEQSLNDLHDEQEQIHEQQLATTQRIQRDKRQNVEKRAKLQLVYAIVPFLDRISHEVDRMQKRGETTPQSLEYISELVDKIEEYNALLTEWVKMEQGQLSLQISSFELEPIFESIRKAHYAYDQKQLTLDVKTTGLSVKADRALTLFMLNTLADNARKFTPQGGRVSIEASAGGEESNAYVELSVSDTGCGLSDEEIATILENKVFALERKSGDSQADDNKGYGFGLMNCKGIIEKYRKTGARFGVCQMGIESRVGQGSRFWFRLPRVVSATITALLFVLSVLVPSSTYAQTLAPEDEAYRHADELYYCNVDGLFDEALAHADSALQALNLVYGPMFPRGAAKLSMYDNGQEAVEIALWQTQADVDFTLLLGIRNEIAVAALGLNNGPLYQYNNKVYTSLFKLINADPTIEDDCVAIESSQHKQRVAIWCLVVVLVLGSIALWFFYFRPRIKARRELAALRARHYEKIMDERRERHVQQQANVELAGDEHRRRLYEEERLHVQNQIIDNCLSTIKHETMYYPGRIKQLAGKMADGETSPEQLATLAETVAYYKELYSLLSAQANEQSAALNFKRRTLEAAPLLEQTAKRWINRTKRQNIALSLTTENQLGNRTFRGDPDLLEYLLESLTDAEMQMTGQQTKPLTLVTTADDRFARFTLSNPNITFDDEQLQTLFAPHINGIPFLLCKQIIREHDTFLGHPGCRICAEALPDGGHAIWFSVPLLNPKL